MTKDQEIRVLGAIEDGMWFLLNSGNPIQQSGLERCLSPLNDVKRELEEELVRPHPEPEGEETKE